MNLVNARQKTRNGRTSQSPMDLDPINIVDPVDPYYLTKSEYFIDIIPTTLAGNIRNGKGVEFIEPTDPTLIQQALLIVKESVDLQLRKSTFEDIISCKPRNKHTIPFELTAPSSSTETLALDRRANFGMKGVC